MSTSVKRHMPLKLIRELILWIAAGIGVISLVFASAAILFGVKPLIFMSGSMNPTIPTGSIALVVRTPITSIKLGDVVSYLTSEGIRVTHRVINVSETGGLRVLKTKGDANKTADVEPITSSYVDREFFAVPGLGYAVNTMLQPQWSFAGGAVVGIVVTLGLRRRHEPNAVTEHDAYSTSLEPEPELEPELVAASAGTQPHSSTRVTGERRAALLLEAETMDQTDKVFDEIVRRTAERDEASERRAAIRKFAAGPMGPSPAS